MNIVFLNPIGSIGGAERVLLDVVAALIQRPEHHRVTVILLTDGPLAEMLMDLGANAIVLPLPSAVSGLGDSQMIGGNRLVSGIKLASRLMSESAGLSAFVVRLRSAIKRCEPDLLYSNGLKTHLLSAVVKPFKTKLVWHLHDFYGARPAVAKVFGLAAKRVDHAIAISSAVEQDTHRLVPKLRISVIHNAVDQNRFTPAISSEDGSLLDRLSNLDDAPEGSVRFGLIATYANWKGHHVFLNALALAREKAQSPLRGYIIGGPIYSTAGSQVTESELRQRVQELGLDDAVGLIPFQNETAVVYQMLDVIVHASTRPEPFGLTIAEAMSCGRPVIVSAAGGATELYIEGVDAIGHIPGNQQQLAEAIVRLADDPALRNQLARQAAISSKRRFSHERFRTTLIQVLSSIYR